MRVVQLKALDEIEVAIRDAVDHVAREPGHAKWPDAAWTKKLKNKLAMLGQDRGFRAYASTAELANQGEWLFDLTWADEPAGFLRAIPLACELEWDPGGVDDDFQKLVVARADHRVMLFNFPPGCLRQLFLDRMLKNVTNFAWSRSTDRYLLGGWVEEDDKFDWSLFVAEEDQKDASA